MKLKALALIAVTVLAGCSTFNSKTSGIVMQVGKDSYTVRALSERSTSSAKQEALTLANASCQKLSRNVMITREETGIEDGTGERFYDLNFMCLTAGDTDFRRLTREPAASAPAAERNGTEAQ